MSASNAAPQRLNLEVRCADSATEVFVIDGQFNLRDRGVGHLKTSLEPGIYKIKVRAGFETREQPVVLRDHDETIEIPCFEFASPAPLDQTSKTHEFQMAAAYDESRKVHLSAGSGGSIFIFVRDWTSDQPPAQMPAKFQNPARGLSLCNLQGKLIADICTQGSSRTEWEPWAAANIEVNPGSYLLKLETPTGDTLQQIVFAAVGWQTQVFLFQQNYGDGEERDNRRADLQGAAILMARSGEGFNPNNPQLRLAELARLGLSNRRHVLSEDLRQMLHGKFENPMLGIFAAHLLLLDPTPDLSLLSIIVSNLFGMVGNHPDVEALALAVNPVPSASSFFYAPPMLRRSWRLIVHATAKNASIVPDGSLSARIAEKVWGGEPWLIWTTAQAGTAVEAAPDVEAGIERSSAVNLETILKARLGLDSPRALRGPEVERRDSPFAAISKMKADWANQAKTLTRSSMPHRSIRDIVQGDRINLKEDKIGNLVQSLNIPRKNVESLVDNLSSLGQVSDED